MFAIGSMALVFAMDVLTDAQRRGNEVAAAQQADQLGQLTAGLIEQASRVAQTASNASYETTFDLPDPVGRHNMTVTVVNSVRSSATCDNQAILKVHSGEQRVATSFELGNVSQIQIEGDCLQFAGEVDTSAQAARIRYDPPGEDHAAPTIVLEPTSQVR